MQPSRPTTRLTRSRLNGSVWNWSRDDSPNTCSVDSESMRARPPLYPTLFDGAPPIEQMAPWAPKDFLENMPTGNAGLDGVTTEWLQQLPIADLQRLANLLTAADEGRTSKLWNYARVALIPKGPDAYPTTTDQSRS